MLIPNVDRVIVKLLSVKEDAAEILMPGQLKAGENLLAGEIVHPGDTAFKKGQHVYYSEYSASRIMEVSKVVSGLATMGEVMTSPALYVVAQDDIMAFEGDELG